MPKNVSFGSNGVDQVRSLLKIPMRIRFTNFWTSSAHFALNSYGNQTVPNAPKLYETHQNVSLGSNGVDRVCSLRKIPSRLGGRNFCTSLARFAPSFVRQPNSPENVSLGSNGVDQVRLLPKIQMRVRGMKFCVYASVQPVWQRVSCSNEKNPKCTQILQNIDKCTQPLQKRTKTWV